MPNFSIPLSGLDADSTALNTIANNLSNMSSVGYKAQAASFSDLFYQSMGTTGAGDAIQVGAGAKIAGIESNFSQGASNTTGMSSNDMEVDGSGFFVVSNGSQQFLTRNGQFTSDTSGHLVASSGQALMGYQASNGVIGATTLSAITLPTKGQVMNPQASSEFTISANLDSAAAANSTSSSTVPVYDSLGQSHNATVTYTKTGNNTWDYSIALPNADFASGACTPVTGTLTFDANGNLASVTTGGATSTVGTASGDISSLPVSFTGLADGGSDLSMKWNLLNTSGGQTLTQVDSDPVTNSAVADGYAAGTYSGFTVDSAGSIQASYSNGQTQLVGQVALADVTNEQGLQAMGNSLYRTTTASGTANVGSAGSGALGQITDSALEESNVDISTEFSNLIVAQRAFEANSKSITTFDTVTQEAINMIH
jgi:flagellar hook protein FlgE